MVLKVLPTLQTSQKSFVEQLISHHLLKSGFRSVLAGKTLEEIEQYLLSKGLITPNELTKEYAKFFGLPLIHLTDKPIHPSVIHLIPMGIAEQYRILAYDVKGNNLYLAIGKPAKLQYDAPRAISAIRQQKGLRVHLAIAPEAELLAVIKKTLSQDVEQAKKDVKSHLHQHQIQERRASEEAALTPEPKTPSAPLENEKTAHPMVPEPEIAQIEQSKEATFAKAQPSDKTIEIVKKPDNLEKATQVVAEKPAITLNQPEIKETDKKSDPVMVDSPQPVHSLNKADLIQEVEPRKKFIDLRRQNIPIDVLNKIPYDVAKKYRIIVFDSVPAKSRLEPSLIKVASLNPDDAHVKEILSYIEQRNKVLVDRYATDETSFEQALKYYQRPEAPTEPKPEAKPSELPAENEPIPPVEPAGKLAEEKSVDQKAASDEPSISADMPEMAPAKEATSEPESDLPAKTDAIKEAPATAVPDLPGEAPSVVMPSDDGSVTVSAEEITNRPTETASELQQLAKQQETSLEDQNLDKLLKSKVMSPEDLAKVFKTGVIPEIVAATLFLAIQMKASDVHIEAEQESVRLRFRIDGVLHDIVRVPAFLHAPLVSRIKILSKMKIDEQRVPQDGRFDVIINSRQVDLRVSTMPTVHGEKVVMRLLDKSEGIKTLEQLGVTGTNFDVLISNINKPYGIILSTGPTGSGKSTTLYAILTRISKPGVNIITLEDPVEYELPGINQAQVKPQIGFTFAEGLRSVLRQDPNVIMVGEIRDLETAAMATHAALTGHLVLSTLHTNDAAGSLPRLIDMGVEPFLITSSINAVIGQRLVRRICDDCREKVDIPPAVKSYVQKRLAEVPSGQLKTINLDQLVFYHGKGCPNCTNGYRGRIGIFEVLPMSEKIEDLAVRRQPASEIKKQAVREGMITMLQDGLMKALKGITTVDEVLRVTTASIKEVPGD